MSTVAEAEALLSRMTPGEKAQLLQRIAQQSKDAYPGIDTIDGVCGGEPVIVRTRIPVWMLEQARRLRSTEADLLRLYPGLRAEDHTEGFRGSRPYQEWKRLLHHCSDPFPTVEHYASLRGSLT